MREFVKNHKFSPEAMALVRKCSEIVTNYQAQGLRLTLRQLYYQLVSANVIRNEEKQYKKLSGLLSDARLMGRIDWEAIEDRIRVPRIPQDFRDLGELVDAALASYRLDRWDGQEHYVELWVEKDALAGILAPIAREYHVAMMVNRGYSSQTAMYDSAKRFLKACHGEDLPYRTLLDISREVKGSEDFEDHVKEELGRVRVLDSRKLKDEPDRKPVLLYLGDHDPSGEDMVRDIGARLAMFGIDVDVRKVALTKDQIEQYDPPPNPAKMTDPRAIEYVDKHGATSWEVDALPPDALDRIIRDALDEVVDHGRMDKIKDREKRDKNLLMKALKSLKRKK
jgi:hypothetical protein